MLGKKIGQDKAYQIGQALLDAAHYTFVEPTKEHRSEALSLFHKQPHAVSDTDCAVMVSAAAYETTQILGFDAGFPKNGSTLPQQ